MDVDVLQTGGSTHSTVILNLSDRILQSATGLIRKIPLLDWHQMSHIITRKNLPDVIHAKATIETTDISGPMQPSLIEIFNALKAAKGWAQFGPSRILSTTTGRTSLLRTSMRLVVN